MLTMLFETGHPWITFKDACNVRSPAAARRRRAQLQPVHRDHAQHQRRRDRGLQPRLGQPACSTSKDGADRPGQAASAPSRTAMRMLDNVIDINYYAVKKARDSNLRHRPVGLGVMGFQDCLYELRMPYASDEAVEFADRSMEAICYYAYWASTELAAERGRYSSYEGSLWDRGILPHDSLDLLAEERGGYVEVDRSAHAGLGRAARAHRARTACATPTAWRSRRPRRSPTSSACRRVDRADLSEPVRQIQPVGRIHRGQRVPGARPEEARACGTT